MKKIITLLCFLVCLYSVNGQQRPATIPNPNSPAGFARYGYVEGDSGFLWGVHDTFPALKATTILASDGNFYRTPGSGLPWTMWVANGGASLGTLIYADTTTANAFPISKFQDIIITGTTGAYKVWYRTLNPPVWNQLSNSSSGESLEFYYRPSQFGADTTGVLDATSAVNACFAAAKLRGNSVYWDANYRTASTIYVTNFHQKIFGNNNIWFTTGTNDLLHIDSCDGLQIMGIKFVGTGAIDSTQLGINVTNSGFLNISFNTFDSIGVGINMVSNSNQPGSPTTIGKASVIGNNFFDTCGIAVQTLKLAEYTEISNKNVFQRSRKYGVLVDTTGNVKISNSNFERNNVGILVQGVVGTNSDHSEISNNTFNHSIQAGVCIKDAILSYNIHNNLFYENSGNSGLAPNPFFPGYGFSFGLLLINSPHVNVELNTFSNNGVNLGFDSTTSLFVNGNYFSLANRSYTFHNIYELGTLASTKNAFPLNSYNIIKTGTPNIELLPTSKIAGTSYVSKSVIGSYAQFPPNGLTVETSVSLNKDSTAITTGKIWGIVLDTTTTPPTLKRQLIDTGNLIGIQANLPNYITASGSSNPIVNSDTGRANAELITGYDLNKVRDSLQTNVNLKVNISDTSSMLSGYGRKGFSVQYTDTSSMLSNLLRKTDTSTMLAPYSRTSSLGSYVKYSDTASMLSNLLRKTDTSNMLSGYGRKGFSVQYTDTSAMLSNLLRKTDTSSMLSNKVNISDTANMLTNYANKGRSNGYTGTNTFTGSGTGTGITSVRFQSTNPASNNKIFFVNDSLSLTSNNTRIANAINGTVYILATNTAFQTGNYSAGLQGSFTSITGATGGILAAGGMITTFANAAPGLSVYNGWGYKAATPTNSGTLSHYSALMLEANTVGTNHQQILIGAVGDSIAGNWGIYNSEAFDNYFGTGRQLINTTTPPANTNQKLTVVGSMAADTATFTGLTVNGLSTLQATTLLFGSTLSLKNSTNTGTATLVVPASSGNVLNVTSTNTTFSGNANIVNYYTTAATPSIAAGAGAGTSPTITLATGSTNNDGVITVTTGTLPTLAATVVTLTFSGAFAFPNGSSIVLSPANATTALLSGATMVYSAGTTTTWTITAGATALTAATTYVWNYHVGGY